MKLTCPKCLSHNIEIFAEQECIITLKGGQAVIKKQNEPKWTDDSDARCINCGEHSVVWFFKRRG